MICSTAVAGGGKHLLGVVDSDHVPAGTDDGPERRQRPARTAADVEDGASDPYANLADGVNVRGQVCAEFCVPRGRAYGEERPHLR